MEERHESESGRQGARQRRGGHGHGVGAAVWICVPEVELVSVVELVLGVLLALLRLRLRLRLEGETLATVEFAMAKIELDDVVETLRGAVTDTPLALLEVELAA